MKFSELQAMFQGRTQDDSTDWSVGGTKNKLALNRARKFVFDSLKNSHVLKFGPSAKTATVQLVNGTGDLPADFMVESMVSSSEFPSNFRTGECSRFYDYDIMGLYGAKKIKTDSCDTLYVAYVPGISDLSGNDDVPSELPDEFHECISDYAMVEYFRDQRDNAEAMNAMAIAKAYLDDKLSRAG